MSPSEAAERGFRDRLLGDATFMALVGNEAKRVTPNWPTSGMTKEAFPLEVLSLVTQSVRRPDIERVRIQATSFVWPVSRDPLFDMAERKQLLFDEQHWTWQDPDGGTWRMYTTLSGGSDLPAGPGEPVGRRQDYRVEVARA